MMKKAYVAVMMMSFVLIAGQVFAGDFASDLKGAFKSTVSNIYQQTGKVPFVGQTMQGAQKFAYNNVVVNSYNTVNGASMAVTGVGVDQNLNNGYAAAVVNPLNNAIGLEDPVRAFQPGTDIKNICSNNLLLEAPFSSADYVSKAITGAGIDKNVNNAYGSAVKDHPFVTGSFYLAKQVRTILPGFEVKQNAEIMREPDQKPGLEFSLYSANGTPEEAKKMQARYKEKCVDDPYWKEYYGESGDYFTTNQCLLSMKRNGDISRFEIGYQNPLNLKSTAQLRAAAR
jgi:hypothetical protein